MGPSPFLWLFALYLAGFLLFAWTQRRHAASEVGFYLGGRRFGGWATGLSLAATTIGASAILTQGELVYTRGFAGVWMDISGAAGLAALALWLVARLRDGACTSLAELAGKLFGQAVRGVAAGLIVLAEIGWLALLLKAIASLLVAGAEVDSDVALFLAAGAVGAITGLGGQHAVTRGDAVHFGLMVAGVIVVALPAALLDAGGELWRSAPAWNFPWGEGWPPSRTLEMLLMVGLPHLVGSDIYAKLLSARSDNAARCGAFVAAAAKIFFGIAVALIALAAHLRAPGAEPAAAVPLYMKQLLPGGLHTFVLMALLATIISSADTVLLTASTVLLHDLFPWLAALRRRSREGSVSGVLPSRGRPLWVRRVVVVLLAAAAWCLATRLGTMVAIFTWAYSIFAAGLSLPILLGLLARGRLPAQAARAGMIAGAAGAALAGWLGLRLPIVAGLTACLTVLVPVWAYTRAHRERPRDRSCLDSATWGGYP
jgi:SSS family solute:Na+ symporter